MEYKAFSRKYAIMPIVTTTILCINVAIHLLLSLLGMINEEWMSFAYSNFALTPAHLIEEWALWQPLSSIFLHFPYVPLHLLVNMIGIWSFGSFLERQIGSMRFLWCYLVSGLCSTLFVVLMPYIWGSDQDLVRPTVGASGALLGLLGSVAVLFPHSRLYLLFFPMKAKNAALGLAVVSLLLSFFDALSFISHNGHLGGLLGGIIYAKWVLLPELAALSPKTMEVMPGAGEKQDDQLSKQQSQVIDRISQEKTQEDQQGSTFYNRTESSGKKKYANDAVQKNEHSGDAKEEAQEQQVSKRLYFDPETGRFEYKD